jgi:hypothetical protein
MYTCQCKGDNGAEQWFTVKRGGCVLEVSFSLYSCTVTKGE